MSESSLCVLQVGEVRAGPFETDVLTLAHLESLEDIKPEDNARLALGVRGRWFTKAATSKSSIVSKDKLYGASIMSEDG